ncbi:hypothetical protein NliqN6_6636 [Naganishia liquefaciens]|uniref:Derlin n=1 Tax=Naganishia liquefaciens TaxID=104408 RepID=A0A8H3YHT2_9TREE|nr:hypothetical protein NliqN6_6636 [Naganishia liquefaciens]
MADIQSLIREVPPVTRFMLVSTAVVTFPVLLKIVSPAQVYLSWPHMRYKYEIWRPWSAFFFGGSGFPLIYDFFLIYRNGTSLEKETYFGATADYAWANIMIAVFIMIINIPFEFPFLFRSLLHAQNYLWCRANPTMKISLFGLLTIPVPYYPASLIVLDLVLGGPGKGIAGAIGMFAGHTWWFLHDYLPSHPSPRTRRRNPLSTPHWFARLFGPPAPRSTVRSGAGFTMMRPSTGRASGVAAGGSGGAGLRERASGGYAWGSGGQRLGDS